MRTATDLHGAFALLEERADTYAAARDQTSTADAAAGASRPLTVELVTSRPRRPANRLAVAGSLAAAAAVVALAAGVALWNGDGSGTAPAGSAKSRPLGPAPRSHHVTLDPKLGMRLLGVNTGSDATGLDFYSRTTHAQVTMIPASAHQRLTPGLDEVELSGGRIAYYSDGRRPLFVQPPSDPATEAPVPTPTPPETRYGRAVAWPFARGAYLQVVFQGSVPTKGQLIRVASGLRVTSKAQPIPSALTLRSAPPGMRLVYLDSQAHQAGDNAPFDLAGQDWSTNAWYQPADGGEGVSIETTSADVTAVARRGAEPVTVSGHRGYWYARDRQLDLDFGLGRYAVIAGTPAGTQALPVHTTRAQLLAIARDLTITAHPLQPSRWPTATEALPRGGR